MIGGLVGAGLNAAGLVERKGSDKAVQDIGPFENIMFEGPGMMGTVAKTPKLTLGNFGGLAGMATQGGFMGNTGGMLAPLVGGLAGLALQQFGPKQEKEERKGFDLGKGLAATAGYLGMGFGDPAFSRGLNLSQLPGGEQGPAQGPNTPIRKYDGQYMPYGPGGGGLPPTPMASMYGGPQMGQAGGLLGNANFFSDPMTIKRVS